MVATDSSDPNNPAGGSLTPDQHVTLYVRLLDEGTPVVRPTKAVRLSDNKYKLLATPDYDPDDEKWEFLPGSIVAAERQRWSSGEILVAVSRLQEPNRGH